ncbi:MAG: hypothetical protein GY714_04040 [Desulfobacterales bacterium]|nr:hypothetical protein [Desulfobacterales bacterium]MCP4162031.1 hypothetical protein [Deltaproteobacteria bacterium]
MKTKMKFNKYWWFGFLGFLGFIDINLTIDYFKNGGSAIVLLNPLWFLWFLNFIPENKKVETL